MGEEGRVFSSVCVCAQVCVCTDRVGVALLEQDLARRAHEVGVAGVRGVARLMQAQAGGFQREREREVGEREREVGESERGEKMSRSPNKLQDALTYTHQHTHQQTRKHTH